MSNDARTDEDLAERVRRLEKEKAELQQRLEFVEELVGPTEAQRKIMQEQLLAARAAALRAKYNGANVPLKVAGRMDEQLIWAAGLSERDAGLLQGGCLPDADGVMQDVSILGDPRFRPYDQQTGDLRWQARGGMLQMSLSEVRSRYGEGIAQDVVRCAQELDSYDSSRRVGIELPWHPVEDRELQPAEVIDMLDRELSLQTNVSFVKGGANNLRPANDSSASGTSGTSGTSGSHGRDNAGRETRDAEEQSPYAAVMVPRRRGRRARQRDGLVLGGQRTPRVGAAAASLGSGSVVPLPRLESSARRPAPEARSAPEGARGAPTTRCVMPGLQRRMHDAALGAPALPSCSGSHRNWIF